MTTREQQVIKALLQCLDALDGAPVIDTLLHAAVEAHIAPAPSLSEFDLALKYCDRERWVIGLPSKVTKKMKWTLSEKGKSALVEL